MTPLPPCKSIILVILCFVFFRTVNCQTVSITGPDAVCPNLTYKYRVYADGGSIRIICANSGWSLYGGEIVQYGGVTSLDGGNELT